MMVRSQKMGGSEKDIILNCVGNGESSQDTNQKRNTLGSMLEILVVGNCLKEGYRKERGVVKSLMQ